MIRHICMFKLKDEDKEANLKEALRRLEEMREIPLIATFEVVTNATAAPTAIMIFHLFLILRIWMI